MDYVHPSLKVPAAIIDLIMQAALAAARNARKRYKDLRPIRRGGTLRPGVETPLWNQLALALRPHLKKYGDRAILARELRLPRQRVTEFLRSKRTMPDAERTLELLGWLSLRLQALEKAKNTRKGSPATS